MIDRRELKTTFKTTNESTVEEESKKDKFVQTLAWILL